MDEKVFMFPNQGTSTIDPGLLALINNNGGFGGNGNWIWILFLFMMWQQNGGRGNFNDYAAQFNGTEGRQYLAEIMNGRFDNLGNLANILNTSAETIKNGIFALQNNISQVGASVGLTAAQTQNAISMGNAGLAKQLCECCCENRLAIANQTAVLQADSARNFAATQLQMAQNEAADQLAVCQQTNTLRTDYNAGTNNILNAIKDQNSMIIDQFCALKERELQNKIDTQGDIITQLRNQISNDRQTLQFNAAFHALDDKVDAIAAKQPNTVPIQWPQLTAVNTTPNFAWGWNNGWSSNSFWN